MTKLSYNKKVSVGKPVKNLNSEEGEIFVEEEETPVDKLPEVVKLLEEAKKNAFEDGFKEGRSKGFEEGIKKKEEELAPIIESLGKSIEELKKKVSEVLNEIEPQIIELIKESVQVVVQREINISGTNLPVIINDILKEIPSGIKINIRLNETELEFVKPKLKLRGDIEKFVEFVSDPEIEKGGCIVETDIGSVDSTIRTRIEKIKELFEAK